MKAKARPVVVLVGFILVVTVIALWSSGLTSKLGNPSVSQLWRQFNDTVTRASAATRGDAQTQVSAPADMRPDTGAVRQARNESADAEKTSGFRNARPSAVETAFEAEAQLLGPDGRLVDFNASAAVLTSTRFEHYMDALATQASLETLAADLTELYRGSATDTARSVEGVSVRRVVCGLKLCLVLGTAPSADTLRQWHTNFVGNVSAPTLESSMRKLHQPDGSVEFRIVFTTDPASLTVHPASRSPVRP